MRLDTREDTPWNIVLRKFGVSQNRMAFYLNCDKSKISKSRNYGRGLIDQYTQVRILQLAHKMGVNVTKDDLIPDVLPISGTEQSKPALVSGGDIIQIIKPLVWEYLEIEEEWRATPGCGGHYSVYHNHDCEKSFSAHFDEVLLGSKSDLEGAKALCEAHNPTRVMSLLNLEGQSNE